MQTYVVSCRKARSGVLAVVFFGFWLLLAFASFSHSDVLYALGAWTAFSVYGLWNGAKSILAGDVSIALDRLKLVANANALVAPFDITAAEWVYSEHEYVVIRATPPMPKFNLGHVRSNGTELTIDGFYGSGINDLPEQAQLLGPKKHHLWRRMGL